MKGEIVSVTTDDGMILQGIACSPHQSIKASACVVHIHGSYGNFYENFFLTPLSAHYNEAGIAFVSCNTRGHDYYADIKSRSEEGYGTKRIGGIREVFADCEHDLRAWVSWCRNRGYQRIILQGHSLGAMKVSYCLGRDKHLADGLILISPPDNIGLQKQDVGDRYDELLLTAERLANIDPDQLMPCDAYYEAISAAAYLGLFRSELDTGMFTYEDTSIMKASVLSKVDCSILAIFGTINEAVVSDFKTCENSLKEAVRDSSRLEVKRIEGANHSYHGKEEELAHALTNWLTSQAR